MVQYLRREVLVSLRSEDVQRAVYRFCRDNRAVAVSECALGKWDACGRADVLGLKFPSGYHFLDPDGTPGEFQWVAEFEVKVSKQDLLKDIEKRKWWFWRNHLPCTHFFYAVPRKLEKEALQAALDVLQMLKGEGEHGKRMGSPIEKMSGRAQVGVIVVDDQYRYEVIRKAARFRKTAPISTVNKIIGRSFWELHKLRGIDASPAEDARKSIVEVGQIWQLSPWHHRRSGGVLNPPKVRVTAVEEGKVHTENVDTGRKSRSKISGFCNRYRLKQHSPNALSD